MDRTDFAEAIDFDKLGDVLQSLSHYHAGLDHENHYYIEGTFQCFDVKVVSNDAKHCLELFIKQPEVIDHYAHIATVPYELSPSARVFLREWYSEIRSEMIPLLKERFFMEVKNAIRPA